jgi:hypothetical protein
MTAGSECECGECGDALTCRVKWAKAVILMQRAGSLVFIDPEEDSPYAEAVARAEADAKAGAQALKTEPVLSPGARARDPAENVPAYLNQPKYRRPKEYQLVLTALDQFVESLGPDGEHPVARYQRARDEGRVVEGESGIPSNTLNVVSGNGRGELMKATHYRGDADVFARCEFGGL